MHVICQEVTDDYKASKWVSTILELFSYIGSIHWPLLVRLWELLTDQVLILAGSIIEVKLLFLGRYSISNTLERPGMLDASACTFKVTV